MKNEALPAISKFLTMRGLQKSEIKAVLDGLRIVRNGNFFKWKNTFFNQISGCALGDPDSCSYSDLAIAHLLDKMVPECEISVNVLLDPFFKVYRDDGLGMVLVDPQVVVDILNFFNQFDENIQWTLPSCKICLLPEATCAHYNQLEFLDCLITWKQVPKGDHLIWQFQVQSYSKPTDCHAYLHPVSCTSPHLNVNGISLAKTVGTRLRTIHSNDEALLQDLNLYCGYMCARGYKESSIKYNLATMANRSRVLLLDGHYHKTSELVVPLVTALHPSTTVLTKVTKQSFEEASNLDPLLSCLIPTSSIVVAYRKLPSLQLLLCRNDQNALVNRSPPPAIYGYQDIGCKCLVCKASSFGNQVKSPSMPGFIVKLSSNITCKSGPAVIYHIVCKADKPQCKLAHYVGRAYSSDPSVYPMHARWSNHKSHFKNGHLFCEFTKHLTKYHRGEDPQQFCKIQLLEVVNSMEEAISRELYWQRKLFAFWPSGLCVRKEERQQ